MWIELSRLWKEDDDGVRKLVGTLGQQQVRLLANPELTDANRDDLNVCDYILYGWVADPKQDEPTH